MTRTISPANGSRLHEGVRVPPNAAAERVSGIPSAAAGRAKPF